MPIERTELLPVTQADRDAAADYIGPLAGKRTDEKLRSGKSDHVSIVQVFARHRISHSLLGNAVTPIERTAEQERAAIVAWLRAEDAKRPSDNWLAWVARMIECGDHIEHRGETNNG